MKNPGRAVPGKTGPRGYAPDADWELADELTPDPFSEEQHSPIHARRARRPRADKKPTDNTAENSRSTEISEDNPC